MRACDIWRRHDSEYSSVRCAVYKVGRISRSKGNPKDLALITKWIWNTLVISSTLLREKGQLLCTSCSGFYNTMDFVFHSSYLLSFVCQPYEPVTASPLTSSFPESYSFTTIFQPIYLLPHYSYRVLLYTSN